jgi:hypothetical protein
MSMETEITCPDCQKVIAPKGSIDESLRCICNDSLDMKDDTDTIAADAINAGAPKTCYVCNADLTGRVRLKDKLGNYWCKECASKDKRKKRHEQKYKCADCSRPFPKEKLKYFQNVRLCATCFREREKKLEKKIKKQVAETIHEKHEKTKILIWCLVVVALLGAALVFQMMR